MAAQPNGIPPPSAEVRRVAFSGRGQDQIEFSAWRASASDASDSWPEWAGCTGNTDPAAPAGACRANSEQGIAVVRLASGETTNRMNQLLRPAALGIYQPYRLDAEHGDG